MISFLPLYALHAAALAHQEREKRIEGHIRLASNVVLWLLVALFVGWGAWMIWEGF